MNEKDNNPISLGATEPNNNPIDFSKLIGLMELKERVVIGISRAICPEDPIAKEYLKNIDYHSTNAILIYGLPGLGKTELLRTIEKSLKNHPTIEAKYHACSEFQGQVGKNAGKIEKVFRSARTTKKQLYIMLLDEVDSIMMTKGSFLNADERTNAFLSEMDGMKDSSKIMIISTTNRLKAIDSALLSRFGDLIELLPPSLEDRIELYKMYIATLPLEDSVSELNIDLIVGLTEGFTGRNFKTIGVSLISNYLKKRKLISAQDILSEISKYVARASQVNNILER